jgi:predicted ATPase
MIKFLKVKDHKGISEVILSNLGHINIICGKNNSGKTSILEAIISKDKVAIGKKVEDVGWLKKLFAPQISRYSHPATQNSEKWFEKYIRGLAENNTVWFSDEEQEITNGFRANLQTDQVMKSFGPSVFEFRDLIKGFFGKDSQNFRPILIPPKRNLETTVNIQTSQEITPSGGGLTNKLFYLKNQDSESPLSKTYEKIQEAFNEITGHHFDITAAKGNILTPRFRRDKGGWISADSCGLGLLDVLVIVTFALDIDYSFTMVEEPESHLHPEMQKKLLSFVKTIKSKQFIFSTHSSVFLNPYVVDKIYYSEIDEKVKVSDETSKSEMLYNLGYSVTDNILSDVVVLTEGPTDIPIISTICGWMGLGDKYNIKYWPLGGDIMADLDLSVFADRKNVISLIDSDPGSKVIRTRFEKNCKEHGIMCHRLKRYSIENYVTLDALKKCFGDSLPKNLTELKFDISVDEQMGFIVEGKKSKTVRSKNHEIIKLMTLADIEGTDLYTFCLNIKQICEDQQKQAKGV